MRNGNRRHTFRERGLPTAQCHATSAKSARARKAPVSPVRGLNVTVMRTDQNSKEAQSEFFVVVDAFEV